MNYLAGNLDTIQSNSGLTAPSTPASLVTNFLPYVYGAAGIVLIINIISSGLKMMTSKGDPKSLQSAQSKLMTSAIGILILLVSFWVVQIILEFLGINRKIFS
jgi:hypothetical protein